MEIEDFFRNLSPCIHRFMGEWPVIHIPGKERILACPIEQLQVKKGRGHPYSSPFIQSRRHSRSPLSSMTPSRRTSSTTSGCRTLWVLTPPGLTCQFFLACGIVGNVLKNTGLFLLLLLFHSHMEAFLWGAWENMPQLKDLI